MPGKKAKMMTERPKNVSPEAWAQMQSELANVTGEGMDVKALQAADKDSLGNDPKMEMVWAEKAGKHAETYLKLLTLYKDKSKFRLTKIDDELYADFRKHFPKMDIKTLDEAKMTSKTGKSKWRILLAKYDKTNAVVDYNMGTLLRVSTTRGLESDNIMIVARIQFHLIEVARNREGCNDNVGAETSA